eukprot:TRINITY_DN1836_c0_g1_i4.p1 TRINITY_DN1836_c0_g1~~TRINITY_DN1836_c0_g1_i4.p1  ORF type:complete len:448 (-),score=77.66 TRINITY_DN1836_c0_g1_i4:31-1374(-)
MCIRDRYQRRVREDRPTAMSVPAKSEDTNEDESLLPGNNEDIGITGAAARVIMLGALAAVSCASALPMAAWLAGVGFWSELYSNKTWLYFNLLAALPLPVTALLQSHMQRKLHIQVGIATMMQFQLALGAAGAATVMGSAPWVAQERVELFYLYGALSTGFSAIMGGSVTQLTSYLSDDYLGVIRTGEALPSVLVVLVLFMSSFHPTADHESVVEFHICVAALVAVGGFTYFTLPLTASIRLIFRMEDVDRSKYDGVEANPTFLWTCKQMHVEIGGLMLSRAVYYSAITTTPYLSSDQAPGVLAQQLMVACMFGDVTGRMCSISTHVTRRFKEREWYLGLVALDVVMSCLMMLVVAMVHGRFVRCCAYFVLVGLNAFLYCISHLNGLHAVRNETHKHRFVLVLDVLTGTMYALSAAAVLLGAEILSCLLYTSPSPRDRTRSRMPSSA